MAKAISMTEMTIIAVRLPTRELAEIDRLARETERTRSHLVRYLLRQAMKKYGLNDQQSDGKVVEVKA